MGKHQCSQGTEVRSQWRPRQSQSSWTLSYDDFPGHIASWLDLSMFPHALCLVRKHISLRHTQLCRRTRMQAVCLIRAWTS